MAQLSAPGDVIDIVVPQATARIARQGAQLLSWRPRGETTDVLWCSPLAPLTGGKAIRGGIPICWPWFGPHTSDPKRPQHGFARNLPWRFAPASIINGSATLTATLSAADCAAFQPEHALDAELTLTIGQDLRLQLTTTNRGTTIAPLSLALHTYFAVSDVAAIHIDGFDGATYRDNTRGGALTAHTGPMRITAETIALFDHAPARQTLHDSGFNRRIAITSNGPSTIVWNPGASAATMADIPPGDAARFVCVESGAIGSQAIALAPGHRHVLDVSYSVIR
jgi:glucose-6-phosphate 1-epimerase